MLVSLKLYVYMDAKFASVSSCQDITPKNSEKAWAFFF